VSEREREKLKKQVVGEAVSVGASGAEECKELHGKYIKYIYICIHAAGIQT